MAGIGAPQSCGAVEQRPVVGSIVMHVLGADDQARRALEAAIGRKRQPIGFEIVRYGCCRDARLCHLTLQRLIPAIYPRMAPSLCHPIACRSAARLLPPRNRETGRDMAERADKS